MSTETESVLDAARAVSVLLIHPSPEASEEFADCFGEKVVVRHAEDRTEALRKLNESPADVIFIAVGKLGLDWSRDFSRIHSLFPEIPFVLLVEDGEGVDCSKVVGLGVQDCISADALSPAAVHRTVNFAIARQKLLHDLETENRQVQASYARYRAMIDNLRDGVVGVGEDGTVVFVNQSAKSIFGKSEQEIVGQPFGYPVSSSSPLEVDVAGMEGEVFRVEMLSSEFEWEGEPGFLGCVRDISERKRREKELRHRIEQERLITSISSMIVRQDPINVDFGISESLRMLGEFCKVDRCFVFLCSPDGDVLEYAYEWAVPGISPLRGSLRPTPVEALPWLMERLSVFETVLMPDLDTLPSEALSEREFFLQRGAVTMLAAGMGDGAKVGFIGFENVGRKRHWSEEEVGLLKIVGEIIAIALERKRADEQQRASAEVLRNLMDNEQLGILVEDDAGRIVHANSRLCDMFETFTSPESLAGKSSGPMLRSFAELLENRNEFKGLVSELSVMGKPVTGENITLKDGRVFELDFIPIVVSDEERGRLWQFRDVSRELAERRARASHVRRDVLTGLSNRPRFMEDLAIIVADGALEGKAVGLILFDLDDFRTVNNTLGFEAGDTVLRMASDRLKECIHGYDLSGRIGGDSFGVVLTQAEGVADSVHIGKKIAWSMQQPFDIGSHTFELGASLGIAMFPENGEDAESLYQNAEMALLQAKELGKRNLQVFNRNCCELKT